MKLRRSLAILALCLIPMLCFGQGKLYTKSRRLSDFPAHTTKVVLSGNPDIDAEVRKAVQARWRLSPYEFCSPGEYEAVSSNPSYYILHLNLGADRRSRESGLAYMTLSKGGNRKDKQSLDAGFDVISVPFAPLQHLGGRECIYLPALLNILQNYVEDAQTSNSKSLMGLLGDNIGLLEKNGKPILLAREELSADNSAGTAAKFPKAFRVMPAAEVDSVFAAAPDSLLVSYVVVPDNPQFGALSYQMVIDPSTHDLFYYSCHTYVMEGQKGFWPSELRYLGRKNR